jgi:unsaturated rhamnogalacturonyl hydrolase
VITRFAPRFNIVHISAMSRLVQRNQMKRQKSINGRLIVTVAAARSRHFLLLFFLSFTSISYAQDSLKERVATMVMGHWGTSTQQSDAEEILLKGLEAAWLNTGDARYFRFLQSKVDSNLADAKTNVIRTDTRALLTLYRVTLKPKYLTAVREIAQRTYLTKSSLTELQRLAFLAEYAWLSHNDTMYSEVGTKLMARNKTNPSAGLEMVRSQSATQSQTAGLSLLQRAQYLAALADILEYLPTGDVNTPILIDAFNRQAVTMIQLQNVQSGLWMAGPGTDFNLETSFFNVYALCKSLRLGLVTTSNVPLFHQAIARFRPVLKQFSNVDVHATNAISSTGGRGSLMNDLTPTCLGALLLAANEVDIMPKKTTRPGLTVAIDNYFNREIKTDAFGSTIPFHYKWWEKDDGGFSTLAQIFHRHGMKTSTLDGPPTTEKLKSVDAYLLVDPDWPKENKNPNYIDPGHAQILFEYVKRGGILILMANDSGNVEFNHFNQLAARFGIHFNENMRHDVINDQFEQAALNLPLDNPVFPNIGKVFVKQLCTQTLTSPAEAVYSENGEVLMSVAHVGKGAVFAVGDPWFYNEYLDGRKLPAEYRNFAAANALVRWIVAQRSGQ